MARDDRQEVIFEVEVDYVQGRITQRDPETRPIEDVIVSTVTVDLPKELERVFGVKTEIYIKDTRYGSIVVFFAAVLTGYTILSSYKGLLESIELIRHQAEDLIERALRSRGNLTVSVDARNPRMGDNEPGMFRRLRRRMQGPFEEELVAALAYNAEFQRSPRDGFFYFLLAFSIVELVVIAVLVGGAVIDKYF